MVVSVGRSAGNHFYDFGCEWATANPGPAVRSVVVYPFAFEGNRRARALAQAERYIRRFGPAEVVDNEDFLDHDEETTLFAIYQRANKNALTRIERLAGRGVDTSRT